MKKEFVSFEIALELKKLEFDELCFSFYNMEKKLYNSEGYYKKGYNVLNEEVVAPLYQQAFRFFREKYRLEGAIYRLNFKWASQVFNIETSTYCFKHELFETYEEAEINSLQKMIEIVKNKSV